MSNTKLLLYCSVTLISFLVGGPFLTLLAALAIIYLHKKQQSRSNEPIPTIQNSEAFAPKDIQANVPVSSDTLFDAKDDFKNLLAVYKTLPKQDEVDVKKMLAQINPNANEHMCPNCDTVHDFVAVRARKCPACEKKMVVRQGLFITELQAVELEKKIHEFYSFQNSRHRTGAALEMAQDSNIHKDKAEYLNYLAEAFRFMAPVKNLKDPKGFSYWDKAWSYYNQARMEEMRTLTKDRMEYTNLPRLSWEMTETLLEEAQTKTKEEQKIRTQKKAVAHAFLTLAEIARFNYDAYFVTDIYKLIKKLESEARISIEDKNSYIERAKTTLNNESASIKRFGKQIHELNNFELI